MIFLMKLRFIYQMLTAGFDATDFSAAFAAVTVVESVGFAGVVVVAVAADGVGAESPVLSM